jgi:hypothetical protein
MRLATPFLLAVLAASLAPLAHAQAGGAVRGKVPAAQAAEFIGRRATVCGTVASARFAENAEGQPTYLFIGAAFPNHPFSARIWGRDRDKFGMDLTTLAGKTVCVTGDIGRANNRPEIVVRGPNNLEVS